MMKDEFLNRISDEAKERFSDDQYALIEYVYTWHPAIKNKEQIAAIYDLPCGYRLIKDMKATAEKAEALEREMQRIRHERDEAQRQLNRLQQELESMAC